VRLVITANRIHAGHIELLQVRSICVPHGASEFETRVSLIAITYPLRCTEPHEVARDALGEGCDHVRPRVERQGSRQSRSAPPR
jgi:hypothetical protein